MSTELPKSQSSNVKSVQGGNIKDVRQDAVKYETACIMHTPIINKKEWVITKQDPSCVSTSSKSFCKLIGSHFFLCVIFKLEF